MNKTEGKVIFNSVSKTATFIVAVFVSKIEELFYKVFVTFNNNVIVETNLLSFKDMIVSLKHLLQIHNEAQYEIELDEEGLEKLW